MNSRTHPHHSDYNPPHATRAAIAVGVAPVVALLAFTLIICDLIGVDIGFALFAACTAWVVVEMHGYQKCIDGYEEEYARRHPFLADHFADEPSDRMTDGMTDGMTERDSLLA
jgi:hypothetical protein